MPKIPVISGKKLVKFLIKLGLAQVSQKGSHIKFKGVFRGKKITVIVPRHKEIRRGTLKHGILEVLDLSVGEFTKMLKNK